MSDQPYSLGPPFNYYDSVLTSNDLLERHVASRVAENGLAALNDVVVSARAGNIDKVEETGNRD